MILTKVIKYCFILMPFGIILGPLALNFISILGAVSFLLISFIKNLKDYWLQPIIIYLMFFVFYLLCLSLISDDLSHSLKSSISLLRVVIFVLAVQYIIENNADTLKLFGYSLFFIIVILSISIIFEYFNYLINNESQEIIFRFSGLLKDEKIGGYLLVHLFPILVSSYFLYKDKILKIFSKKIIFSLIFLTSFITLISIILAGERTALFYCFLFILLSIFLTLNFNIKILFYFLLIISIPIVIINSIGFSDRYYTQTFDEMKSNNQLNIISTKHSAFYQTSWKMFKNNYLTGVGPNMYRKLNRINEYKDEAHENPSTHPHNTYMQLLAETGIIGFLFVFSLFIYVTIDLLKQFVYLHLRKKSFLRLDKVFLLILILISLWPLAPSMNFFGSFNMLVLSLPLGIYLARCKN